MAEEYEDRAPSGGELQETIRGIKVSALEVAPYLHGVIYPATKGEIIRKAQHNGATPEVMDFLESIPDQDYFRMLDIIPELEEAEET